MNLFSSLNRGLFQSSNYEDFSLARARLASVMKQLWRAQGLATLVTFFTGIMVGLLIPSSDWPLIIAMILTGAVLHRLMGGIGKQSPVIQER
ncbi:MAG: hypothetical protein ACREQX_15685 [Candidatus Binataceae bacterium]